jgi:hypothetical protein
VPKKAQFAHKLVKLLLRFISSIKFDKENIVTINAIQDVLDCVIEHLPFKKKNEKKTLQHSRFYNRHFFRRLILIFQKEIIFCQ